MTCSNNALKLKLSLSGQENRELVCSYVEYMTANDYEGLFDVLLIIIVRKMSRHFKRFIKLERQSGFYDRLHDLCESALS